MAMSLPTSPGEKGAVLRYTAAVQTDVGRRRRGNEDSFCVAPDLGLYVVADGMGGHAAGEVASRLAVKTIRETLAAYLKGEATLPAGEAIGSGSREAAYLVSSIQRANRAIFDLAAQRPEYAGMGTTVVAALTHGRIITLAYVGDSRIYRVRGQQMVQVSRDHSVVQQHVEQGILSAEEAQRAQYRHMITRAVGLKDRVEVDLTDIPAAPGDVLLLCSDGLSDMVKDGEIQASVASHVGDLEQACRTLIERANSKGGDDNITTLLIRVQDGSQAPTVAPAVAPPVPAPPVPPARPRPAARPAPAAKRGGLLGWLKRQLGG
jgi:PPM family protein phosphatase